MNEKDYNDRIDLLNDEISDNESEIEMMELEIRILERERDDKYPKNKHLPKPPKDREIHISGKSRHKP